MSAEKHVFLHLGMEKTGSSYLQKLFFPKLEGFDPDISEKIIKFINMHRWQEGSLSAEQLAEAGKKFVSDSKGHILVSEETFTGRPNSLRLEAKWIAQMFEAMFPQAKILIFIRRQDSYLESHYKMAVLKYSKLNYTQYLSMREPADTAGILDERLEKMSRGVSVNSGYGFTDYRVFSLEDIVSTYADIYGDENVFVMPYERLFKEFDDSFSKINTFLGTDVQTPPPSQYVNKGLTHSGFYATLFVNRYAPNHRGETGLVSRLVSSLMHRLAFGVAALVDIVAGKPAAPMSDEDKKTILTYHQDGNKRLSERFSLDLSASGYF